MRRRRASPPWVVMKSLLSSLLLLTLVLGGLTSCTSTSTIIATGLRIELTQVQRMSNGEVQVTWRFHNPNVVSYLFSKVSLRVALDGTQIGTIEDKSPLGLPAANHADRTGILVPAGGAANQVIEQALARGSAPYRVDSTVWVLIVDDEIEKIPLSRTGSVPVIAQ